VIFVRLLISADNQAFVGNLHPYPWSGDRTDIDSDRQSLRQAQEHGEGDGAKDLAMFATWRLDDPNISKMSSLIALTGVTACFIIFDVHDRLFNDYHCGSLEWQRQTIEASRQANYCKPKTPIP
jgi:hypothetical protein